MNIWEQCSAGGRPAKCFAENFDGYAELLAEQSAPTPLPGPMHQGSMLPIKIELYSCKNDNY